MLGFEKDEVDFEGFIQKVRRAIEKRIDEDSEVIIRPITKLNGVIEHGISIKNTEKNVVPTVYLEDFYEAYNAGTTFTGIIEKMMEVLISDVSAKDIDVEFFSDYGRVRDKLGIKLINAKNNKELLEDVPHRMYLDLAVVCYVAVRNQAVGNGSILVHNNHIMMWGVSESELILDAIENVSRIEPGRMFKITDLINDLMEINFEDGRDISNHLDEVPCELMVLTNESRLFGASVLVYKGILESIAKSVNSDFYIIPSSIHEVLILPTEGTNDYYALNSMVQEVNNTQLLPMEVLSDHVYLYSHDDGEIRMCLE